MRMSSKVSALLLLLAACGGGAAVAPVGGDDASGDVSSHLGGQRGTLVSRENARAGTTDWRTSLSAQPGQLEGYADRVSVEHGEAVGIHARADGPHTLTWQLFRMGWYHGDGARLVASGGPVDVGEEPTPTPDPSTGLVACDWPTTFPLQTDASWPSGVYLLKMTRDDGPEQYVPLVVRADERKGVAVVQASVTTWQAYNFWGGESLYKDSVGLEYGHARKVSFDRPYDRFAGAGDFPTWELPFVEWVESRGYDVTYVTDVDVDRDPSLLDGQKLFVSVGHDEYWSKGQRDGVEDALAAGTSLAFFSGNSAYWQIRYEPSAAGDDRRVEVCYKEDAGPTEDPEYGQPTSTVKWRSDPVDRPENGLMGVMSEAGEITDGAFVVSDPSHWIYDGTGVRAGDVVRGVVGYESDERFDNGEEPDGLRAFGTGVVLQGDGSPETYDAVSYESGDAFVVSLGTIEWSWGLSRSGVADERVQRMTDNVFRHAGMKPATAGDAFGAGTWPQPDFSHAAARVSTLAGKTSEAGFVDGPASLARFDRPDGVAVDAAGDVFVADTGNHAIRMIANDPAHTVTTIVGTGTAGLGEGPGKDAALKYPTDVVVAPDGSLYVSDTGNRRIVHVARDADWTTTTFAGSAYGLKGNVDGLGADARFYQPTGLAMVGDTLYVVDTANCRLSAVDPSGDVTSLVDHGAGHDDGPAATARLYSPTDVTAGGDGALYVLDSGNRSVRRVDLGAMEVSTVAGGLPGGFADGDAASAQMMPFGGIAWRNGALVVADNGNLRLRTIEGGQVTTWAGAGTVGGDDGAGDVATFGGPFGLAVRGDGSVVVADNGASTVRVVQ